LRDGSGTRRVGEGWAERSLGDLIDHLTLRHATSLAAIERGHDRAAAAGRHQLRSLLGQLGVAWEAQWAFEKNSIFPRIRALEAARLGHGAWPETFPDGLRAAVGALESSDDMAGDLVRAVAACLDEEKGLPADLREDLSRLCNAIGADVALRRAVLYPRAALLEPESA
jgi:hypothetical protein